MGLIARLAAVALAMGPHMLMIEMVPETERVKDWTEMLTTQVFYGRRMKPAQGEERGYSFVVWMSTCPRNPATAKPEYTWYKAIQGNDKRPTVRTPA